MRIKLKLKIILIFAQIVFAQMVGHQDIQIFIYSYMNA